MRKFVDDAACALMGAGIALALVEWTCMQHTMSYGVGIFCLGLLAFLVNGLDGVE